MVLRDPLLIWYNGFQKVVEFLTLNKFLMDIFRTGKYVKYIKKVKEELV